MKVKSKPLIWIVLALGAGAVFLLYRQNAAAAALRVAPDPASVQVVPSGDAGGASYGGSSQGDTSLVSTYTAEPVGPFAKGGPVIGKGPVGPPTIGRRGPGPIVGKGPAGRPAR